MWGMKKVIPNETWQVAMEIETAGASQEETALLILHLEETVKKHRHICKGFKVSKALVVDIHKLGEYNNDKIQSHSSNKN